MRLFLFFVVFLNLFSLSSCKKNKPADEAFFLKASKVNVSTSPGQGTGSHKITDLWLYVNDQFQGMYPVGKLMPIVSHNQPVKINIFAGIKNNGISDTRIFWSFYQVLALDTFVDGGKSIERPITFKYNPFATFLWNEDFEGTGFGIKKSDVSYTNFRVASPENSFEGRSIEMSLSGDSLVAQIESASSGFDLPEANSNVYLELNYKGNEEFVVGLLTDKGEHKPALNINPQENWNKIYVHLAPAINSVPYSNFHKIYIRLLKKNVDNPRIFIDNIKVIHL